MANFLHRHRFILLFLLLTTALGVATFFIVSQIKEKGTFEKVVRGNIVESIYGIGTIKSNRVYTMKVGIPSVVQKLFIKEGERVNKGQALLDLDIPKRFTAPFSGVVTALWFKSGETVFPQSPILTLTDFSDRYLLVSVEQQGILNARIGQTAQISFENMRQQKFQGQVSLIFSNPEGFFIRIDAPDLPENLLPEMSADVAITVRTHDNVLLVPVNAIDLGNVYIKKSEITDPIETPITVGLIDGKMAQVVAGEIKEGDLVRVKKEK